MRACARDSYSLTVHELLTKPGYLPLELARVIDAPHAGHVEESDLLEYTVLLLVLVLGKSVLLF